ncbi:diguanylate cyclase [Photobacterium sp. 2_MG-2023]|uniref:diguanylate cyclase n=1 Tax=Photobacterium sp. 2_MG-2023 TaxID=3062663 RepID=UPI0026E3E376|nr:diguanylate cyclase [Photobacterium sp. 2_MG-2023]MDO6581232.1 diguanylate cyclase [Photobacterium sp. 2_MG-2023]
MNFKPKYLIKMVLPLLVLLVSALVYLGYSDYRSIRESAYSQARANLNVAKGYLDLNYIAVTNQLFLLSEILKGSGNIPAFLDAANYVVNNQNKFLEVGLLVDSDYYGTDGFRLSGIDVRVNRRPWYSESQKIGDLFLSDFYHSNSTKKWCVALVKKLAIPGKKNVRIIIELDAGAMSDDLSDLKTMTKGYVYAIEPQTRRVVIHPDKARLGVDSVSINPELLTTIMAGNGNGNIPSYEYDNQYKFSVYDANNNFNWVLLSGTSNSEIASNALKVGAVGGTFLVVVFFILLAGYLHTRVHQVGGQLIEAQEFDELHEQLSALLNDTMGSSRVYLFVMNANEGVLEEAYHNLRVNVPADLLCRIAGCQQLGRFCKPEQDDIVRLIAPSEPCIRLPLVNSARQNDYQRPASQLIGVLYICQPGAAYPFFAKMIANYTLSALNQILLTQHIRSEDQMTGLKNKNSLRQHMDQKLMDSAAGYFLAMIDVDDFKSVNDTYGHLLGDEVILNIASLMEYSFPAQAVLCRYGGEEFAVLMEAPDTETALKTLDDFRAKVEASRIDIDEDTSCAITVSIGVAPLHKGMESTISSADRALYQAKSQGKNQVLSAEMCSIGTETEAATV